MLRKDIAIEDAKMMLAEHHLQETLKVSVDDVCIHIKDEDLLDSNEKFNLAITGLLKFWNVSNNYLYYENESSKHLYIIKPGVEIDFSIKLIRNFTK